MRRKPFFSVLSLYAIVKEPKSSAAVTASAQMVGVPGLEPGASSLSGTRSNQLSYTPAIGAGGAEGARTPDILLAKQVL